MWRLILGLLLLFFSLFCFASKAMVFTIDGIIGPATQDYINRSIEEAKSNKATLIILELNTPGGLDVSTRGINNLILSSPIPIVSYVTPSGARAASAGTYIIYASPIAAMAPGTHIGAATPVNLIQSDQDKGISNPDKKALNDSVAYIRSLAILNHRNADWAELAVREAVSITADQAKQLNVIDYLAPDLSTLLQKIDSKTITLKGQSITIKANDLEIERRPPDWRYHFLSFITHPNIAYLLILIAIYGLFFELSSPGLIFPGVMGLISLLIVLYAFQIMPVNYTGLTLVLVGITFMIIEVFVTSFGVIGLGGIIAFIIGSIMLFDSHPSFHLALPLIFLMSGLTILFFYLLLNLAIRSQRKAITTGREALIGSEGIILNIKDGKLTVRVLGEIWEATADQELKIGQIIKVTGVKGLVLNVEPAKLKEN